MLFAFVEYRNLNSWTEGMKILLRPDVRTNDLLLYIVKTETISMINSI